MELPVSHSVEEVLGSERRKAVKAVCADRSDRLPSLFRPDLSLLLCSYHSFELRHERVQARLSVAAIPGTDSLK